MHRCRWLVLAPLLLGACGEGDTPLSFRDGLVPRQPTTRVPAPIAAAHCTINVEGIGDVDAESDYIPNVVRCENGGANLEALMAQAIAARSVAYYAMEVDGSICDSQGCQVYSCGASPDPIHYEAVDATSGIYLHYNSTLTYGFYVAGDSSTAPPACVGDPNASTEQFVTYNEGKTGTDVEQTTLGFVHDPMDNGYGQNRGCMAQWGARCLENDNGYDYLDILQFYYGADINLEQAPGDCVIPGVTDTGDESSGTGNEDGGSFTTTASSSSSGGATGSGEESSDDGPFGTGGGSNLPDTYGFGDDDESGCGCRSAPPVSAVALWLLAAGWLSPRRRRR